MSQALIYEYMKKVRRPVTLKEISLHFDINYNNASRTMVKLSRLGLIICENPNIKKHIGERKRFILVKE